MKRHGNLWKDIVSLDNLREAHRRARRGKHWYRDVKRVDANPDRHLLVLRESLVNRTFTTSPYEVEDRFDGRKLRTIYKLPYYPDRIVQHALLNVVGPILTRCFIRDTFQSITGRGTSDAFRRVRTLMQTNPPRYALKLDIAKYYPNVDNSLLKAFLREKIKCADTLWLIDNIIDSMPGLPIGNYTSQIFGNWYLNGFDWWVKQTVKPQGYFRYCDDIVLGGPDKPTLRRWFAQIVDYLAALKLTIKPSWRIYDVIADGVDFVGYVFRPTTTRVRPQIAAKFRAACRTVATKPSQQSAISRRSRLMSYRGWLRPARASALWDAHMVPLFGPTCAFTPSRSLC